MINLLPGNVKQSIGYGRHNTMLFKWIMASLVAIVGLILVIGFGMVYLTNTAQSYSVQIDSQQEQLKAQKLEETQKEIENISGNLKLSVDVLSREVLFSKLIQQIAAAIPSNALTRSKQQNF
jgi:uncharacterized membrane-anchored protein YhcB (DUF1043 family)